MRRLALLAAILMIAAPSTATAQTEHGHAERWEAGPTMLAGVGLLVGGSLSFRVIQASRFSVSAEVSGFTPVFKQLEWGCLNSTGCWNGGPPPQASALASAGIRTTIPLFRRWYAVADAALVEGHWHNPVAGTHRTFARGLGMGHRSRTDRWSLEVRWQRLGTGGVPASTWRVGWLRRW